MKNLLAFGLFTLMIFSMLTSGPCKASGFIDSSSAEYEIEARVIGIKKSRTLVREDHMWQRRVTELTLALESFENVSSEVSDNLVTSHLQKNRNSLKVGVRGVNMDDFYKKYQKRFGSGVKGNLSVKGTLHVAVDEYSDRTQIVLVLSPDSLTGDKGNWPEK